MKKGLALFVTLLMLLSSLPVFAGSQMLSIGTGGTSGTYYPLGGEIANMYNETIEGVKATAQVTGASVDNLHLIERGDAELGLVQNDVAYYAITGTEQFDGEPLEGFAVMASLYPEVIQLVARVDSGIATLADLKGKRVSIGSAGSGTTFNAVHLLSTVGLTLDDIDEQYLSFAESASAAQDRAIDAFFISAGIPNAAIMELANATPITVVEIPDAQVEALIEQYPFYMSFVVPAGTYAGVDADVKTVAITALLVGKADLDEELVYQMTKNLFERKEDLLTHAKSAEISVETALNGVGDLPLHPGSARYYTEAGVLK